MTCKNIQCTHKFSSTHTGEKIIIYSNANCKTENIKTMVNASIVVTPLFQMSFQFPKPFFGGLFVGADAFDYSPMKHLEITSPFWILTPPVKMVLYQLTYTTNRQINISTCPHRVVILSIAPKVFRRAKPRL
jgi:hypothetical protein